MHSKYSMKTVPHWEVNNSLASQEIPTVCGILRLIAVFTTAHNLSLFWTRRTPPSPRHPFIFLRCFIIILPPVPESSERSVSLWFSHEKRVCIPLLPHTVHMPKMFGDKYKPCNSSLCTFLHPPHPSFLFGSNILTLFCGTPLVCFLILMWCTKYHTYKTTGKILFLYYIIRIFLVSKREYKKFWNGL